MTSRHSLAGRVEHVASNGQLLALVIRASVHSSETTFFTSEEMPIQVGRLVFAAKTHVAPHRHPPFERHARGTAEVLIVQSGHTMLDLYDAQCRLVSTHELGPGDIAVLLAEGHGLRHLDEEVVILEVRNGPYLGPSDKERF